MNRVDAQVVGLLIRHHHICASGVEGEGSRFAANQGGELQHRQGRATGSTASSAILSDPWLQVYTMLPAAFNRISAAEWEAVEDDGNVEMV